MPFLPISFNGSATSHFGSDRKNIETCCKAISGKKKGNKEEEKPEKNWNVFKILYNVIIHIWGKVQCQKEAFRNSE